MKRIAAISLETWGCIVCGLSHLECLSLKSPLDFKSEAEEWEVEGMINSTERFRKVIKRLLSFKN